MSPGPWKLLTYARLFSVPTMPPKRLFLDKRLYVQVSTIPNAGKGLFTLTPIPAGAVIGEYTGRFLPLSAMYDTSLDRTYFLEMLPYFKTSKNFSGHVVSLPRMIMDGKDMDNKMRWINDPRYDKPRLNAEVKQTLDGVLLVLALKDIKAGEEILMSYGDEYWKEEEQAALRKLLVY